MIIKVQTELPIWQFAKIATAKKLTGSVWTKCLVKFLSRSKSRSVTCEHRPSFRKKTVLYLFRLRKVVTWALLIRNKFLRFGNNSLIRKKYANTFKAIKALERHNNLLVKATICNLILAEWLRLVLLNSNRKWRQIPRSSAGLFIAGFLMASGGLLLPCQQSGKHICSM